MMLVPYLAVDKTFQPLNFKSTPYQAEVYQYSESERDEKGSYPRRVAVSFLLVFVGEVVESFDVFLREIDDVQVGSDTRGVDRLGQDCRGRVSV